MWMSGDGEQRFRELPNRRNQKILDILAGQDDPYDKERKYLYTEEMLQEVCLGIHSSSSYSDSGSRQMQVLPDSRRFVKMSFSR